MNSLRALTTFLHCCYKRFMMQEIRIRIMMMGLISFHFPLLYFPMFLYQATIYDWILQKSYFLLNWIRIKQFALFVNYHYIWQDNTIRRYERKRKNVKDTKVKSPPIEIR